MHIVDQFNDPAFGVLLREVSSRPALEELVKTAEIEPIEADTLPESAFAWPEERRFPIHTDKHAALSRVYAQADTTIPVFVHDTIKKALDIYEIPEEVFKTAQVKIAEENPEDVYLLPAHRLFPVRKAADVKTAELRVLENLTKLDLESRAIACGNLIKQAGHYDVKLHPRIEALAGFVVSSTQKVAHWLEARSSQAKTDLLKVAYQQLADDLKTRPPESGDRASLLKLASVIAELDEKAGLDKHYDRKLPDALQTVFNTDKIAAECVDLNGKMVSLKKLGSFPASFWEDLGGKELANEVAPGGVVDQSKLATVLNTLPLDLKISLRAQCA